MSTWIASEKLKMNYHQSQFFPARNLLRFKQHSNEGAWLIAYKEEQKKRFGAVLCSSAKDENSRNYQCPKANSKANEPSAAAENDENLKVLDGLYLLKQLNVEDPSDLVYVNIAGKDLNTSKKEDFVLFDNVVHIEAGENNLSLETFKTFPALCELELQLNQIRSLCLSPNDFNCLESLDLSFNSISSKDVLSLGSLSSLKCLHLTGNGLKELPAEMANTDQYFRENVKAEVRKRFQSLEVLYLDENSFEDIAVFASIASLPRLKVLSLAKNKLQCVPELRLLTSNLKKSHILPTADWTEENYYYELQDVTLQPTLDAANHRECDWRSTTEKDNPSYEMDSHVKEGASELQYVEDHHQFLSPNDEFERLEDGGVLNEDSQNSDAVECKDISSELGAKLDLEEKYSNAASIHCSTDLELLQKGFECPFQSLEKLDLTFNLIAADQALLPLAAWPRLTEINIWNTPLAINRKGISPLLHYHLTKLCGIRINRQEPLKASRPTVGPVIAPVARYNRVHNFMPTARRKNVLLLEFEKYEASLQNGSLTRQTLSRLSSSDENRLQGKSSSAYICHKENAADEYETYSVKCQSDAAEVPMSKENKEESSAWGLSDKFSIVSKSKRDPTGVFLTQVDISDDISQTLITDKKVDINYFADSKKGKSQDMIKELLKTDESIPCNDVLSDNDLNGNIKALKLAIDNPLFFNKSSQNVSIKPVLTGSSQGHETHFTTKSRQSILFRNLDGMRKQKSCVEENLDTVLQKCEIDARLRGQFPDVKKLLNAVQAKYDKIRLRPLDFENNAERLLKGTTAKTTQIGGCEVSPSFLQTKIPIKKTKDLNTGNDQPPVGVTKKLDG